MVGDFYLSPPYSRIILDQISADIIKTLQFHHYTGVLILSFRDGQVVEILKPKEEELDGEETGEA